MFRVIFPAAVAIVLVSGWTAKGQDNPVLREYLGKAVKKELAKHNTEETAWHNEKSQDKEKWSKTTVGAGKWKRTIKVRVAEWTEESKTWIWLDDPEQNLHIDITTFEIKEGVLAFGVRASGKASGKAWGKIPNLVTADVKGSAKAEIEIEGKARISDGNFTDVEITKLTGKVSDLRFSNDALKAIHGLIQDCVSEYVKSKNNELKKDLKKAIEGFRL